jgi:hypothetical protein
MLVLFDNGQIFDTRTVIFSSADVGNPDEPMVNLQALSPGMTCPYSVSYYGVRAVDFVEKVNAAQKG